MIRLPLWSFLCLFIPITSHAKVGGPNCNIALKDNHQYPCLSACLTKHWQDSQSFVCDISAQWLHHAGGSQDWYPATPPLGTGVHEYVAFQGTPPCQQNGHCMGCDAHAVKGTRVCSVKIDPTDCSVTCDETAVIMEMSQVTPF